MAELKLTPEIEEKLAAVTTIAEAQEVLAEAGVKVDDMELQKVIMEETMDGELDEESLEDVSGGKIMFFHKPLKPIPIPKWKDIIKKLKF